MMFDVALFRDLLNCFHHRTRKFVRVADSRSLHAEVRVVTMKIHEDSALMDDFELETQWHKQHETRGSGI